MVTTASFLAYGLLVDKDPQIALLTLAVGSPLGVLSQVLMQVPALLRHGVRLRLRIDLHDPCLRETVSIGARGSGVYFNAIDVLSAYDLTLDDITPVYQSFADSADSLKDDKIDAAFIVAGAPTTAITDLSTTKTAYLVSMDDEHVEKLIEASPYYAKAIIPADVYGLESDTTTVSVGAVVLASNYIGEDAIYGFTKSLFDGASDNAEAHAKYSELSLEEASSVKGVPYHPGAAKYYEEQGITVEAAELA